MTVVLRHLRIIARGDGLARHMSEHESRSARDSSENLRISAHDTTKNIEEMVALRWNSDLLRYNRKRAEPRNHCESPLQSSKILRSLQSCKIPVNNSSESSGWRNEYQAKFWLNVVKTQFWLVNWSRLAEKIKTWVASIALISLIDISIAVYVSKILRFVLPSYFSETSFMYQQKVKASFSIHCESMFLF